VLAPTRSASPSTWSETLALLVATVQDVVYELRWFILMHR
jgi:hypothetical protein